MADDYVFCFVKMADAKAKSVDEWKKSVKALDEYEVDVDIVENYVHPVSHLRSSFFEQKNPIYAVKAYQLAMEQGYYPPVWVLEWLNKSFEKFQKSEGSLSIDRCLGLQGKQKSSAIKKAEKFQIEYCLANHMWVLLTVFNKTIPNAAVMVYAWVQNTDWGDSDHSQRLSELIKYTDSETLEQYWHKKWKHYFKGEVHELILEDIQSWNDEEKENYMKQFPVRTV